ncbi:DUF4402 domain-containing protein [Pseudoalteromonas sp. MMG006]|uniref:DUF4402 domain-containing protein n=1 Tax=Pseudoalteromonas sp. MMG006 TaxID=2822683 RepID=UPI001B397B01|nr:DUF4402 domain-containing protein [Pseudoalteromonas sp. MMG006]MBQ4799550.1 DUF4402 domain-containing protein [Pseudoalteromonas sp. MMG006]
MNNFFTKAALVVSIATLSFGAVAETTSFQAGVTVQNAFTLTNDAALDFGTIRASADLSGAQTASLELAANPATSAITTSTDATAAEIAILVAGTPASFSVSGVSPFGTLTITDPTETAISPDAAPAGTAAFTLGTPTYYVLTGAAANSVATTTIQVDSNGEATFNVGATLTTTAVAATSDYIDGSYSGTFTLELNY